MAWAQASYSGNGSSRTIYLRVDVTLKSQDKTKRTSTISVSMYAYNADGTKFGSWEGTQGSWSILGKSGKKALDFRSSGTNAIWSGTHVITHNAAGAGSVSIAAKHTGAGQFGSASLTKTYTAPSLGPASKVPDKPAAPTANSISYFGWQAAWKAPSDNGAKIDRYQYSSHNKTLNTSWTTNEGNFLKCDRSTGCLPGSVQEHSVRAHNAHGWGPWSSYSTVTLKQVPVPKFTVEPQADGKSALVAITPTPGVPAEGMFGWDLSYQVSGSNQWKYVYNLPWASTPQLLQGLTPGVSYDYEIQGVGTYHHHKINTHDQRYHTAWSGKQTAKQPKPGGLVGDYFDGSTTAGDDDAFSWEGAAHESVSLMKGLRPKGWGVNVSDGADAKYQDHVSLTRATGTFVLLPGNNSSPLGQQYSAQLQFAIKTQPDMVLPGIMPTAVEDLADYVASLYVMHNTEGVTRDVWLRLEYLDSDGVILDTFEGGVETLIGGDTSKIIRLSVRGLSPTGTVTARWGLVTDTDWTTQDNLSLDCAMLSLGDQHDYFDGATAATSTSTFVWGDGVTAGTPNESISTMVPIDQTDYDPLADPSCPSPPKPPRPPKIIDPCIVLPDKWTRKWIKISSDATREWLQVVPTFSISTGVADVHYVRLRTWANPNEVDPEEFSAGSSPLSEALIRYIPGGSTLTLDSISNRTWVSIRGSDPIPADKLLTTTSGAPATYPVFSCNTSYLVSLDIPVSEEPAFQFIAPRCALTVRYI